MMRDTIANPSKTLSEFRKELQSAGFANAETLVPRRGNPVTFQMGRVGQTVDGDFLKCRR